MDEKTKDKAKDVAKELTQNAAAWLKEKAKSSTGVMRWVYGILFILAAGALAVFFSACETVPKVTAEQVQVAHALYHAASGEPCVFVVESVKK